MIRTMCRSLAAPSLFALLAFSVPAMAQDPCIVPYSPTVPKGETATQEQINASRADVLKFISVSDEYQACLNRYLAQVEETAKRDNVLVEPRVRAAIVAKGEANQREKERVGNEFNGTLRAFRAAHPAP